MGLIYKIDQMGKLLPKYFFQSVKTEEKGCFCEKTDHIVKKTACWKEGGACRNAGGV